MESLPQVPMVVLAAKGGTTHSHNVIANRCRNITATQRAPKLEDLLYNVSLPLELNMH